HLLGESRYLDARDRGLRSAWGAIERYPTAHNALLLALEEYLAPPISVVIRGDKPAEDWHRRCAQRYAPQRLALVIPSTAAELPGLLARREAHDGAVAYLCEGQQCHPAIKRFEDFDRVLCGSEAIASG
ncbi:MAG: thioredoxin domain-containing protein, partial [Gammaproteobacteria bacterium]